MTTENTTKEIHKYRIPQLLKKNNNNEKIIFPQRLNSPTES